MRSTILALMAALAISPAYAAPATLEEAIAGLFTNRPNTLTRINKDTVSNGGTQFHVIDREKCIGSVRTLGLDDSVSTQFDGSGPRIDGGMAFESEYRFLNAIPDRTRIERDHGSEEWRIEGKDVECLVYRSGKRECLGHAVFNRVVPGIADEGFKSETVDASMDRIFHGLCKPSPL